MKISIIGAGKVGASAANYLLQQELGEIVLIDIRPGWAEGLALDLMEAAPLQRFERKVSGSSNFAKLKGSDVVVVAAGFPRQPGMTRLDLIHKNKGIIEDVCRKIKKYAPKSIVILVTNPLDVICHVAFNALGFPKHRVIGMAGVLDSSRLRHFIADELKVSVKDVDAMVLGQHGKYMLPLLRYTTVSGVSVLELIPGKRLHEIVERTRTAGEEIVSLLKKASAFFAPGSSIAEMVESIVGDKKRILPSTVLLEGEYGLRNVFVGVPCTLGRKGVEKIIKLKLHKSELKKLHAAAKETKKIINELKLI